MAASPEAPSTPAESAEPAQRLVRALYRLGIVQRAITREALAELGSQGFLALAIVHRLESARVSDVAQHGCVDLSVASRQVAALTRAGYVERTADPEDGRAQRLAVTPSGRIVLEESHRRMVTAFEAALGDWDPDAVEALAGGLDRLREDFAEHHPFPRPTGDPS